MIPTNGGFDRLNANPLREPRCRRTGRSNLPKQAQRHNSALSNWPARRWAGHFATAPPAPSMRDRRGRRERSRQGFDTRDACWPGRFAGRMGHRASCPAVGSSAGSTCARNRRSHSSRRGRARGAWWRVRSIRRSSPVAERRSWCRPDSPELPWQRAPSACAWPRSASVRPGCRSFQERVP